MRREERALELVERIYAAVIEPEGWITFLKALSEELGGAAILLSLRIPDVQPPTNPYFCVGLDDAYRPAFVKHAVEGLPWGSLDNDVFRGRFGLASEVVSRDSVPETGLYRDYMQPQGLAPEWPICHVISREEGHPLAGMVIFRREGGPPIGDEELGLLDLLVPHLARAYAIHCQLGDVRQERRALSEVVDRLPMGVILLDANGVVVQKNRSADRILALEDGLAICERRPHVDNAREERTLRTLIANAVKASTHSGTSPGDVMAVTRPSGRRAFPLMVGPLLAASPHNISHEAKAIVFVADPEGGPVTTTEVLETLYGLTRAEAALVRLIAKGRSLDEVAAERGVTIHTVRSQLKQVFSKTETSRQGELVHLALTGVASIQDDPKPAESHEPQARRRRAAKQDDKTHPSRAERA